MKDSLRESLSYWGLYRKMFQVKKLVKPLAVSFGKDRQQYFLYYEPEHITSDKVILWVHGGGPYSFSGKQSLSVRLLLNQLFTKGYDRTQGEPCSLMAKSPIPMLLIQSRHDGLISYSCAEDFYHKAQALGNPCELYSVVDKKDTHSWYTAGMFLETREQNQALNKFFTWIEKI